MSLKVQQRGRRYRATGTIAGRFVRFALGTANNSAAAVIVGRIERAFAEGPDCNLWQQLKRALPPNTFAYLARVGNYKEKAPAEPPKV